MKKLFRFLIILLIGSVIAYIALTQCKSEDSSTYITDELSKEYVQDTSKILVPISIDLTSFERTFNEQMDKIGWFYEEEGIEVKKNISLSYRIKKDGNAQLYPQNDLIKLKIPLYIEIEPDVSGPLSIGIAKGTILKARVILNSDLKLDLAENWELATEAETSFEIIESPKISIAGFTIDFDKQLNESLVFGKNIIDEQIEEQVKAVIQTREIIELIWDEIRTPYHIAAEPFDSWAMVTPLQAKASDIIPGGPGIIETSFLVDAIIDIKTGDRPLRVNTNRIPDAVRVKEHDSEYTELSFPLLIPYMTVIDYMNKLEKPISFTIPGDRLIELSNYSGVKKDNHLEVKADFTTGSTSGELTLLGVPTFDKNTQTIDLEIKDIKTSSNSKVIDQLVASLQKNKKVRESIEENLSYDLREQLADLTFEVTNQIKSTQFHEYAKMDGYVNHIKIKNIYLTEDSFLLATEIEAKTSCIIGSE